ncbi:MAG: XcyI family restriction endonuclease [Thermomicrobiales bacterium]
MLLAKCVFMNAWSSRAMWLTDALSEALARVDPNLLKAQLSALVPTDVQQILAAAGIRDEHVFPTPIVIETQPTLVSYYRLLLGVPQKTFYGTETGMGIFRSLEAGRPLGSTQREALTEYCRAMSAALAELVRQLSPTVTPRDVAELPLLTLGSQFQGGNNNVIGQAATKGVFLALAEVVRSLVVHETASELRVGSPDGGTFLVSLGSDPDVRLQKVLPNGDVGNLLSIEIKGGTDRSNVYNRGGEAEKSHQSAKEMGYEQCWTVIGMKSVDVEKLKRGSPTTNAWFDTAQVLSRVGDDWERFRQQLRKLLGN